jgi:hypothetical protein
MSTVASIPGVRSLRRSQVLLITVFFMICILVSGGSFGLEDIVSSSGPGLTILLLILLILPQVFRAMCGGPADAPREAASEALVLAEAEAAEEAF